MIDKEDVPDVVCNLILTRSAGCPIKTWVAPPINPAAISLTFLVMELSTFTTCLLSLPVASMVSDIVGLLNQTGSKVGWRICCRSVQCVYQSKFRNNFGGDLKNCIRSRAIQKKFRIFY